MSDRTSEESAVSVASDVPTDIASDSAAPTETEVVAAATRPVGSPDNVAAGAATDAGADVAGSRDVASVVENNGASPATDADFSLCCDPGKNEPPAPEWDFGREAQIPLYSSIKVKTLAGIFLVTIIPLFLLGIYAHDILTSLTKDLLIKGSLQAFQQVKSEIDQYIGMYDELTTLLARDERLLQPDSEEAIKALQLMDRSFEFIQGLTICDDRGCPLAHSHKDQAKMPSMAMQEAEFCRSSDKVMFSPGSFHLREPIGEKNSLRTVLLATVSFRKLRKTLEGMAVGTTYRFYLVTRSGENILGQEDFPEELVQELMKRPFGGYNIDFADPALPARVGVVLPVLRYGLRVVIIQDASEVYAAVTRIRFNMFLAISLVALLACCSAIWFSFRITSPIIAIARKADQLAGGNLKVNVTSSRNDEIGFLARCFNRMTARIRKKVFELSTMYRVSQLVSHASSYQRALDDALAHLVTVFLAQRGSILLLSDDDNHLHLRSIQRFGGINEDKRDDDEVGPFQEGVRLAFGEGIAGTVMQTCKPILCTDCSSDQRFKAYPVDSELVPPSTLLCVPLVIQGSAFGVVNLVDRSVTTPFSKEDSELLETITAQMAMSIENARLHELAITDGLTKLFIHRYFQVKLDDEMKRSKRYQSPLTLLLFDIDHFKMFNDTYGHQQGDTVLREVARLVKHAVRATDLPCRYGGEEFVIILAHTTAEQAFIFAERLRRTIEQYPFPGQKEELHVTISIGLAEYPCMAKEKSELIKKADVALYQCKARGRNCTTIWSEQS